MLRSKTYEDYYYSSSLGLQKRHHSLQLGVVLGASVGSQMVNYSSRRASYRVEQQAVCAVSR